MFEPSLGDTGLTWQLENDPRNADQVEIRFSPVANTRLGWRWTPVTWPGTERDGGPYALEWTATPAAHCVNAASSVWSVVFDAVADLSDLAAAERRDLAEYLDTLTEEQWEQPSLCPGWTVRDVVGHLPSYDELGWPGVLALFTRSKFSLARCNQVGVEHSRRLSTDQLVARLRTHAVPRGITTMFGSAIALTDGIVHHQDIRRALGHRRTVPEGRLVAALNFLPRARALPAPANVRNLRLVATDVDWSHGNGPEVNGPGEALLVALAGRRQGLADLSGPGLATLAERVAGARRGVQQ